VSFYCLVTGVLSGAPEQVRPSTTKRRPLYRGSLVIEANSGIWLPARFATWSTTVAEELGSLGKGDAIAMAGRMTLGAYRQGEEPRIAINIQVDRLVSLPHPARARRSVDPDDPLLEDDDAEPGDEHADPGPVEVEGGRSDASHAGRPAPP
jgi:hypothetical protein